jgi:hypothetical protein
MGEGLSESKLPPEAAKALRQAQAMINIAQSLTAFLKARKRVIDELPPGLARGLALESLGTALELRLNNITAPRLNLPGGQVVGINRGDGKGWVRL